jgi:uncharacterized protein (TIGR02246 family)
MMTTTSQAPVRTDEQAEVFGVLDTLYAAWADGDAAAFADLYTDDATVVLSGGVYQHGKSAIRAHIAAGFDGPLRGSRAVDTPKDVRVFGDTAIVVSDAGVQMAGETQIPAERERTATWVFTRHTGTWLIAAYHNCPSR